MEHIKYLHKLRRDLKQRKYDKLGRENKIRELTEKMQTNKTREMTELQRRRTSLLNDKSEREKHNITNQKGWEQYIKNTITKKEEDKIIIRFNEVSEIVHELEDAVKVDRVKIADMEWELKIDIAFVENGYGIDIPEQAQTDTETATVAE